MSEEEKNLEYYIKKQVDSSVKTLEEKNTVKLSTCYDWKQGWYGANAKEEQAKEYVIDVLRNKGYRVSSTVNHGVTDYMVYPNIDLSQF